MLDGLKNFVTRMGHSLDPTDGMRDLVDAALADIESIEKKLFANELPTQKVPMRFEPTHIKCIRNEPVIDDEAAREAENMRMTQNDLF